MSKQTPAWKSDFSRKGPHWVGDRLENASVPAGRSQISIILIGDLGYSF